MKLVKWLCLVAACIMTLPAFGKRKLPLHGMWAKLEKTLDSDIPIVGSIEESTRELLLEFSRDLGDVIVTVTDTSGKVIFHETVLTTVSPTWSVTLDQSLFGGTVTVTDGLNLVYGEISF